MQTNTHPLIDKMVDILNDKATQEELADKFDNILIAVSEETRDEIITELNQYRKYNNLRMRPAKAMLFYFSMDENIKASSEKNKYYESKEIKPS